MIVVDLFAGLGGWTEAAESLGLEVAIAANYNEWANRAHSANHPRVKHIPQDLQQANFREWPRPNLVLASPACQGHSRAATGGRSGRGKQRGPEREARPGSLHRVGRGLVRGGPPTRDRDRRERGRNGAARIRAPFHRREPRNSY